MKALLFQSYGNMRDNESFSVRILFLQKNLKNKGGMIIFLKLCAFRIKRAFKCAMGIIQAERSFNWLTVKGLRTKKSILP
jgi:hypothetical protein